MHTLGCCSSCAPEPHMSFTICLCCSSCIGSRLIDLGTHGQPSLRATAARMWHQEENPNAGSGPSISQVSCSMLTLRLWSLCFLYLNSEMCVCSSDSAVCSTPDSRAASRAAPCATASPTSTCSGQQASHLQDTGLSSSNRRLCACRQ
jgi:hypothetical protein